MISTKKGMGAFGVALLSLALFACGNSDKFNRAAYDVCLADGKKAGSNVASATFASFENSKITSSAGDDYFRVNIPYEMNGQKGIFQCIAEKKQDGSFKIADI